MLYHRENESKVPGKQLARSHSDFVGNVGDIKHCPRILSLDGGGVRGLSSLLILREVWDEIEQHAQPPEPPLPCQYFDLISSTSTGGLITIILGRPRMVYSFNFDSRLTSTSTST